MLWSPLVVLIVLAAVLWRWGRYLERWADQNKLMEAAGLGLTISAFVMNIGVQDDASKLADFRFNISNILTSSQIYQMRERLNVQFASEPVLVSGDINRSHWENELDAWTKSAAVRSAWWYWARNEWRWANGKHTAIKEFCEQFGVTSEKVNYIDVRLKELIVLFGGDPRELTKTDDYLYIKTIEHKAVVSAMLNRVSEISNLMTIDLTAQADRKRKVAKYTQYLYGILGILLVMTGKYMNWQVDMRKKTAGLEQKASEASPKQEPQIGH